MEVKKYSNCAFLSALWCLLWFSEIAVEFWQRAADIICTGTVGEKKSCMKNFTKISNTTEVLVLCG